MEPVFVSAGCNRSVKAAAWGACDLVAFAVHHSVAIFCPQSASILVTLPGHKEYVNCVEWFDKTTDEKEHFLLSGSADGVIILWALNPSHKKWRVVSHMPNPHAKSVTCISCVTLSSTEGIFASSYSGGVVNIWSTSTNGISHLDSINSGPRAVVSVAIARLPENSEDLILAMASLDNHIHLYVGSNNGQFKPACKLKGHQDWVRSLDFSGIVNEDGASSILLASSSQDRNIRIWNIKPRQAVKELSLKTYIEGPMFHAGKDTWQASLESLLVGHEDWVYSVCWRPSNQRSMKLSLLSSSMDKTMMIWSPESKTGIWINEVTVGELSQTAFGFYGGVWSPKGDAILAHGFNGSFHLWRNCEDTWLPQLVPSGHFGPVVDIAWARNGQFLLSASHDQTTRVFTNCNKESTSAHWHEIARPQVHGHDINCLAVIPAPGNHRYVSGAEEKVARVFEAPSAFLETLSHLIKDYVEIEGVQILGANMSALGLSQKPIYSQGETNDSNANGAFDNPDYIPNAVPTVLTKPPLEEQLMQNTLWPESHKLYGHGNELFSMCCSHAGDILATACKAQTANVAEIWLWETKTWRAVSQLHSHTLTVTQMEFSHNDLYLLSVSRDRHLSVFKKSQGDKLTTYELLINLEAHKRIVWTCAWSPRSNRFATGSRDKYVKLWYLTDDTVKLHITLPAFSSSVTAIAWSKLLAIGMESGLIELWDAEKVSCLKKLDPFICHGASVNRLCWKNRCEDDDDKLQLASCGEDHTVRLFNVNMHEV